MNKEEMICKNCKYHYIEEITFDYPQSCCSKRSETTEQWCKCNNFEYGDRYIEQLQQKVNQLETNKDEAIEYMKTLNNEIDCLIDDNLDIDSYDIRYEVFEKILTILEGGKE